MKLLDEIKSYVTFVLILIGIAGLSMDTFKDGGFLERAWGIVWDAEMRHPLLIIPTVAGVLLVSTMFLRGGLAPGKSKSNPLVDVPIYLFMACGAYYLYQWLRHH